MIAGEQHTIVAAEAQMIAGMAKRVQDGQAGNTVAIQQSDIRPERIVRKSGVGAGGQPGQTPQPRHRPKWSEWWCEIRMPAPRLSRASASARK